MNFYVVTIFPEMFDSYLNESILKRAIKNKKLKVKFYNPRDFIPHKSKLSAGQANKKTFTRVDDKPYGGGPGMVMQVEPIIEAVEKIKKSLKGKTKIILFSPSGKNFSNSYAERLKKNYKNIILICGRYEGIDERVRKILKAEKISIGNYVLTGGELAAIVLIDSVSRRIPDVLGSKDSVEENRISSSEVYTRPEVFEYKSKKYKVPKVLLSGNHKDINEWRNKKRK